MPVAPRLPSRPAARWIAALWGLAMPWAWASPGDRLPDATPPPTQQARAVVADVSPLPDEPSPDGVPQRLVLALDGVPHRLFVELQAQGHFRDFGPAARMVSSFPSLSGVSFAAIGGGAIPEGYQEMRYDPDTNQVVGNTLYTLSGRAHQNLPADNSPHSLTHRVVGYMAPYAMAMRDLQRIHDELLASHKAGFVAYLAQSDVIMHVDGADAGRAFLLDLETWLARLQADVRARTGRGLLVDLVSDHGSTLVKGREVDLPRRLKQCGFRRNDTLDGPRDVAYSLAGIIGSVAVSTLPESVAPVSRCLAAADGVELVAVERGDRVGLLTGNGDEAELWLLPDAPERYAYRRISGDPLGLLAPGEDERSFDAAQQFRASLGDKYPDALRRLWRAFHGSVQDPSPILLSLADGREAGYRTVRSLAWLRGRGGTHGSLTSNASLGILVSNWRTVDDVDCWSAREALFGDATRLAAHAAAERAPVVLQSTPASPVSPATASDDASASDAAPTAGGGALAPGAGATRTPVTRTAAEPRR